MHPPLEDVEEVLLIEDDSEPPVPRDPPPLEDVATVTVVDDAVEPPVLLEELVSRSTPLTTVAPHAVAKGTRRRSALLR